jgi:FkbM family methyltransferase
MVMNGSLVEYFKQTERGINFLDIGASGGPDPKWEPLFNFINYTAFEPHKDSYAKIQSKLKGKFKHLEIYDFALSDFNGDSSLYITKSAQCSSMLQPNENWLSRFEFRNFFELKNISSVPVRRLDSIQSIQKDNFDIIKIDVQGAELKVMDGGSEFFKKAFLIETESGFTENYVGESRFDQIANRMIKNNYLLFDLNHNHRIPRSSFHFENSINNAQPLWCEATWLKDLIKESEANEDFCITKETLLVKLMICAKSGFLDYALELLRYFNKKFSVFSSAEEDILRQEESWKLA